MSASPYWFNDLLSPFPLLSPNTEWQGDPLSGAGGGQLDYGSATMGGGMGGAAAAAGTAGSNALQEMASRTLPASQQQRRWMGKGIGTEVIPGRQQQLPPRANVGLGIGSDTEVPAPLNQAAVLRPITTPTGAEWPAGPVVKNNYSNLNGLKNRAYGASYGTLKG